MKKLISLFVFAFLATTFVYSQNLGQIIVNGEIESVINELNSTPDGSELNKTVSVIADNTNEEVNLQINNKVEADLQIHVYNHSGEMCQTLEIRKDEANLECSIKVSDLPNGEYFFEINMGERKSVKKIIKS